MRVIPQDVEDRVRRGEESILISEIADVCVWHGIDLDGPYMSFDFTTITGRELNTIRGLHFCSTDKVHILCDLPEDNNMWASINAKIGSFSWRDGRRNIVYENVEIHVRSVNDIKRMN